MNRDYIDWLETLPCNRKPQKLNAWIGEWGPPPWTELQWVTLRNVIELAEES